MPITVNFEKPIGVVLTTRQFNPGDEIRVTGKVTGITGLAASWQKVRLEIVNSFEWLYIDSWVNTWGHYWFDIILPNTISKADVIVTSWFPVGGAEQVIVPIGIGAEPEPIPTPPAKELIPSWVWLVGIGVGVVLILPYLPKRKLLRR